MWFQIRSLFGFLRAADRIIDGIICFLLVLNDKEHRNRYRRRNNSCSDKKRAKSEPYQYYNSHRAFSLKRSRHYSLDGMHTVFGFIEDDGLASLDNLVGDLHTVDTEFFVDIAADSGIKVVECG